MIKKIKDCKDRFICIIDDKTGYLESKYQKHKTEITLPVGAEIKITRDDKKEGKTITIIKRITSEEFEVNSTLSPI